jgi:hypothetical protein
MGPFGPALALACRIVLAGVLAIAAVAKIADRRALPERLRAMGVGPERLSVLLAVALPVVESVVAIALVVARDSALPALVALAMLIAFSAFLVATIRRAVPCACFGTVATARALSGSEAIMRNGFLAALAVLATGSADGARAGGTVALGVLIAAVAAVGVRSVTRLT